MANNKIKADLLGKASLSIANTLADAEIQALVAAYGYSPENWPRGRRC